MVHAMAKDRGKLLRVAWFLTLGTLVTLGACGPRVRPDMPFPEEGVTRRERAPKPQLGGRQVVVGELCPRGAAGRPAVAPLLMRTTQWIDAVAEVTGAVERGSTPALLERPTDFPLNCRPARGAEGIIVHSEWSRARFTNIGAPLPI